MDILTYILSYLYFFLPAYFANMTPPLAKKANIFNFLDKEVDFGRKFLGKPIFGKHKSWRGALLGIAVGVLVAAIQRCLYQFPTIQKISFLDYRQINLLFFGLLISGGAICGDLFFAFIKRQLKMAPGARFIPFDQTNYVVGAAFFLAPFFEIAVSKWIVIFILTFFLHLAFNRFGCLLNLHKAKW